MAKHTVLAELAETILTATNALKTLQRYDIGTECEGDSIDDVYGVMLECQYGNYVSHDDITNIVARLKVAALNAKEYIKETERWEAVRDCNPNYGDKN